MRLLLRLFAIVTSLIFLLVLATPLLLYQWGLSNVEGRPLRPTHMADAAEQARIWKQAGGDGTAAVDAMNPYGFFVRFFADSGRTTPGETVAYWIARSYLPEHRREPGMAAWHVSVAALTIWLTRNWSTEEILTVASQAVSADRREPMKTPK
ncbi:hypothetical protein ACFJGW_19075 [Burkholderiaceae bacterium UC74_6]